MMRGRVYVSKRGKIFCILEDGNDCEILMCNGDNIEVYQRPAKQQKYSKKYYITNHHQLLLFLRDLDETVEEAIRPGSKTREILTQTIREEMKGIRKYYASNSQ